MLNGDTAVTAERQLWGLYETVAAPQRTSASSTRRCRVVLRTRAVSAVATGDYITLTVRPLFTSIHTNSESTTRAD